MKNALIALILILLTHPLLARTRPNFCSILFSLEPNKEFSKLRDKLDDNGSGWKNIVVESFGSSHDETTNAIIKIGWKLALLIRDERFPDGKRMVYGYLYDVKADPFIFGKRTLVITSIKPELVPNDSQGLRSWESGGWSKKLKAKDVEEIELDDIERAKLLVDISI